MENGDKRTKCSNVSKHKLIIRVCARRCSGKMVSVLDVFGACDFAVWPLYRSTFFFTWGICIDGSLTITFLIPLPPSGDDDPM